MASAYDPPVVTPIGALHELTMSHGNQNPLPPGKSWNHMDGWYLSDGSNVVNTAGSG